MTTGLSTGEITIRHGNGRMDRGLVLSRDGDTMRVAVKGADDAALFTCVHGTWISEDCEPVEIRFAYFQRSSKKPVTEADCICSKELAASLIRDLFRGDQPQAEGDSAFGPVSHPLPAHRIV